LGGNRKGCPYIIGRVNPQDEMDVIGQDDEFIQRNGGEPPRQHMPDIRDDASHNGLIQNALAPLGAEGLFDV